MRKIIVSTDFSAEAENATVYAAKAAAEHKYELVLFTLYNVSVHAQNTRFSGQVIEDILTREKKSWKTKLILYPKLMEYRHLLILYQAITMKK